MCSRQSVRLPRRHRIREIVRRVRDRRVTVRREIVHKARDRKATVRKVTEDRMVTVRKARDRRGIVRKVTEDRMGIVRKARDRRAEWGKDRRVAALTRTVSLIRMRIRMQYRRDRLPVDVMTEEAVRQAVLRQILQMS